jgi:hypothetical protein
MAEGKFIGELKRPLYGSKAVSVLDPNWREQLNATLIDADRRTPRQKALDDARDFGNGFVRIHPDGREEHIPLEQVRILGKTVNVKAPVSKG